jgi:DNA-binding NarL/FixJ family response regulator
VFEPGTGNTLKSRRVNQIFRIEKEVKDSISVGPADCLTRRYGIASTGSGGCLERNVAMMPGMNGVELAITITQNYPGTKILLFSGQAGISQILEESMARGFAFPLLAKPVHPSKLVEGLKTLG